MYNKSQINNLVQFVKDNATIVDKKIFADKMQKKFELKYDKPIYYCDHFAVRVSFSAARI